MHRFFKAIHVCFISLALNASLLIVPLFAEEDRNVIIRPLPGKIQIDGILDETIWQASPDIVNLTQVEPRPGEPPTEATKVWFAYTKDSLYIAARCEDRNPKQIVTTEMRRDAFLMDNDNIEIVLDTYHDHRNAYFFSTNPGSSAGMGWHLECANQCRQPGVERGI
jgi:hypothetical protein